ncbi:hypothetical protein FA13DRAFT_1739475, partial [Coprinellus micaceus]
SNGNAEEEYLLRLIEKTWKHVSFGLLINDPGFSNNPTHLNAYQRYARLDKEDQRSVIKRAQRLLFDHYWPDLCSRRRAISFTLAHDDFLSAANHFLAHNAISDIEGTLLETALENSFTTAGQYLLDPNNCHEDACIYFKLYLQDPSDPGRLCEDIIARLRQNKLNELHTPPDFSVPTADDLYHEILVELASLAEEKLNEGVRSLREASAEDKYRRALLWT